jgi:hypothetical protein
MARCRARCSIGFVSGHQKIAVLELKAAVRRNEYLLRQEAVCPRLGGRALFVPKGLS